MLNYFRKKIGQIRYVKNLGQVYRYFFSEVKSIELAITYNCNFKCKGCYAGDLKEKVFMKKEDVIKYIEKYKPMHVNLTGGEPMLHPDIFWIIKHIPKSIVISMVSNGSLLNKDKIIKLKEAGLNTLQISFGKNYPIEHNCNMAEIAKKVGLNVCLSITNTKENENFNVVAIQIAEQEGYHVLFNLPHGILEKDFDREFYFKYRDHPLVREDNMFWNGRDRCPAGTKKIYITARGQLMPCDRLHTTYDSYEQMKYDYKHNCVYCTRWGNLK